MIDTFYTKRQIISLLPTIIKTQVSSIIFGIIMSIIINVVGWNVIFASTPISQLTSYEQQMIMTNDFMIISICRVSLFGLFMVCIFVLYKDSSTSIIVFMRLILLAAIIVELSEIVFIIVKLIMIVVVCGPHFDLHMKVYVLACTINITFIFSIIHLFIKTKNIYNRVVDQSVYLKIKTSEIIEV